MEQNSEDFKLKVIQELTKGNVKIGQFIMEVNGTNIYNENRGHEEKEKLKDEEISRAIISICGKEKPLNEKQLFLGVICVLLSKYGWAGNWAACCEKISKLPMYDTFDKKCDYNSIKVLTAYKFASVDYKDWDDYNPSPSERIIFKKCKYVADAFDEAISTRFD